MLGAKCSWKLLLKLSFQFETFLRIFHAWWEVFKIELNPAFETVWQINIQASQIYLTFNFRQTFLILWTTNRQTKIYLYLKVSIQSLPKDLHNSVRQTSWKFKILPIVCRQHGDIKLATCYGHLFSLHTHILKFLKPKNIIANVCRKWWNMKCVHKQWGCLQSI